MTAVLLHELPDLGDLIEVLACQMGDPVTVPPCLRRNPRALYRDQHRSDAILARITESADRL